MELRGALRISKFQKSASQPKYYGSAEIAGKVYTLKGWEKTDGLGRPWISILFEEAEEAFSNMHKESKGEKTDTSWKAPAEPSDDWREDDIPF